MEGFVIDLDVLCSDGVASDDDPAGESSDVVCPSVSRTSAVARTFGPSMSEVYSPVVFAGGGGGGRLPMHAPLLSLSQIQRECLSCLLLVVSSRPFFLGKVAFDVVGLGIGPPCLRVDSGGNLIEFNRRASPVGSCRPGRNPGG